MRQAKCLFTPKIVRFLAGITLPDPLPFAGIEFERTGSMRYQGNIDYRGLVAAARDELAVSHPEHYKIFLLALGAGLRRAEIDTLTWGQIDWENATIWIGSTEHLTPKTEDSQGTVDVDAGLLAALRHYQPSCSSDFVIKSNLPPRPDSSYQYYRAAVEFNQLNAWLRKQ